MDEGGLSIGSSGEVVNVRTYDCGLCKRKLVLLNPDIPGSELLEPRLPRRSPVNRGVTVFENCSKYLDHYTESGLFA